MRILALCLLFLVPVVTAAPTPVPKEKKQEVSSLAGAWRCVWGPYTGQMTLSPNGDYVWVGESGDWEGKWEQTGQELFVKEKRSDSESVELHHRWKVKLAGEAFSLSGETENKTKVKMDRLKGL